MGDSNLTDIAWYSICFFIPRLNCLQLWLFACREGQERPLSHERQELVDKYSSSLLLQKEYLRCAWSVTPTLASPQQKYAPVAHSDNLLDNTLLLAASFSYSLFTSSGSSLGLPPKYPICSHIFLLGSASWGTKSKTHKRICNSPKLFHHLNPLGSLAVLVFPAMVKEKRQAVFMGKNSIQDKSL